MLVSIKNLPRWTKASISITLGLLLGGALTYLFLRQKPKKATQDHGHGQSILDETSTPAKNKRILVLGLSGAGKSSILNRSKTKNETQEIKPTEGFNVICLQKPQMTLNIWEIGGSDKVKPYWANFIPNTNLLVFVIDSSSEDHLKASEKEFHKLMSDDRLNGVPILLLANKQDLPGAKNPFEIEKHFCCDGGYYQGHDVRILGTCAAPHLPPHPSIWEVEQLIMTMTAKSS